MYKFELPPEMIKDLWRLREYCAEGPISQQIRRAVSDYLKAQEKKIGCSLKDVVEGMRRYEQEKRATQKTP